MAGVLAPVEGTGRGGGGGGGGGEGEMSQMNGKTFTVRSVMCVLYVCVCCVTSISCLCSKMRECW